MSEPVDEVLRRLGGVASRRQLLAHTTRRRLEASLDAGGVRHVGRDRYLLPEVDGGPAAAMALTGAMGLTTAALGFGWAVARVPVRPCVVVPRTRKVAPARRRGVDVRWWDGETDGITTTPTQTVIDCLRHLPLVDAVCVGDSALRSRMVTRNDLEAAALASPRNGRSRALELVGRLDGRAENPFESATRALTWQVPGLQVHPQLHLPGYGRPDLCDPVLRLLLECDSFGFHSARAALLDDIERYNRAALLDHVLLRFGYEHVFDDPDYVVRTLTGWVEARRWHERHAARCPCPCCAA